MRNLLAYPVTEEEIINTLTRMMNNFVAEERIGDMRAYILQIVISDISKNGIEIPEI